MLQSKFSRWVFAVACVLVSVYAGVQLANFISPPHKRGGDKRAAEVAITNPYVVRFVNEAVARGWKDFSAFDEGDSKQIVFLIEDAASPEGRQLISDRILEIEGFFGLDLVCIEGIVESPDDPINKKVEEKINEVLIIEPELAELISGFDPSHVHLGEPLSTSYSKLFKNKSFEAVGFDNYQTLLDQEICSASSLILRNLLINVSKDSEYLLPGRDGAAQLFQLNQIYVEYSNSIGDVNNGFPSFLSNFAQSYELAIREKLDDKVVDEVVAIDSLNGKKASLLKSILELEQWYVNEVMTLKSSLAMRKILTYHESGKSGNVAVIAHKGVFLPLQGEKGSSIIEMLIARKINFVVMSNPSTLEETTVIKL